MTQPEATVEQARTPVAPEPVFPPHWKRNFVANFVDVAFFSLAMAFASMTTIVPVFLRQLGATPLIVGIVPALVQTGQMLPPLFAAPYIAPLDRKLPFLLAMTVGERLPWLVLSMACLVLAPTQPFVMLGLTILLLTIFGVSGGICTPAWMDIVARVTPMRLRGQLFGWSGALSGLLGVGGGIAAGHVLATFTFPANFALCFAAASVCMLVSFLALAAIREPVTTDSVAAQSVRSYLRQLPVVLASDHDFRWFILVRIMAAFAGMAIAFVALYATEQHSIPAGAVGGFTAWMLGTQVITTPLFGIIADRYGYKSSVQFAIAALTLAMGLSLVVTTASAFAVVFALIGAMQGLMFTSSLNIVVEFASPAERVTYLGLHGTLVAPATLLAPVLSGWFVQQGGYRAAFVAALICGMAALVLLTLRVRDPRPRQSQAVSEPTI